MTTQTRPLRASRGCLLVAAQLVFCLALLLVPAAAASAREVRIGTPPVLPQGVSLLASDAAVSSMQVTIALQPRDQAALATYAQDVSSPGSDVFHRFLTTAQFRARFAPTAATVRAVDRSLRAHGLQPGKVDASGLALTVTASGGQLDHAFHVTLSRVRLRGGRDAIFNVQAPAVDSRIAGDIEAVIGLDTLYPAQSTLSRPHLDALQLAAERAQARAGSSDRGTAARSRIPTGGPQPCSTAVNDAPGSGGYTADQIANYYDFSPLYKSGDLGQGVTIGVYELESDLPSDIAAFQQCYGTNTSVSYVKVQGGAGTGAGSGEAALDIDQLISFVPKAKLLVYQGPNSNNGTGPYDTYAAIANQDKASIVTTSWGSCEPEETAQSAQAESTVFEQMAAQGQTLVAAAGDSGSEDCFIAGQGGDSNNNLEVDDPSSQPFVTGVGGTSLELGPFNTISNPDETVWNNSDPNVDYNQWGINPGAGGGGLSGLWQMPSYQSATAAAAPWLNIENSESVPTTGPAACAGSTISPPAAGTTTDYCREVPDVSADADPMDGYMSYWNGTGNVGHDAVSGWQGVGGTSAAAPLWAAVFALAEASSACDSGRIGFANPTLYSLASSSPAAYASYFNDITADANASDLAGDNNDLSLSGNSAGLYEAGTGYDMATGLGSPNAANLAPALCNDSAHLTLPSSKQNWLGQHVGLQLAATLPAGQTGAVTYSAKGLPKGLHLDASTGRVTGSTSSVGVFNTVFSATSATGTYGGHVITWIVAKRPHITKPKLADATSGRPLLSFTVVGGADASSVSSVTVKFPPSLFAVNPAQDISVVNSAGGKLAHKLQVVHGQLEVTLVDPQSSFKIVFNAGSLGAHVAQLPRGTSSLQLSVNVVETDDASYPAAVKVRPTA